MFSIVMVMQKVIKFTFWRDSRPNVKSGAALSRRFGVECLEKGVGGGPRTELITHLLVFFELIIKAT